jgi:hypothetical protein
MRYENKELGFQKVLIWLGIGGSTPVSRIYACHDTHDTGTECAMAHFAGVDFDISEIRKMALADLPGNPVPRGLEPKVSPQSHGGHRGINFFLCREIQVEY